MKVTIEHYDEKYTVEFAKEGVTLDEIARAIAFLLTNAGWSKEKVAELFKDGWPGDWDSAWKGEE